MDLEMTGLDPDRHTIIEIACIITDSNLVEIAQGPTIAIRQPESILLAMDEWNTTHHRASGLWERVLQSPYGLQQAEEQLLQFLQQHVGPRTSPLCGNSIGQDRRFLYRYMPTLSEYLHYRNIDVSTIKELVSRWYPQLSPFEKQNSHRALDDIRESIEELRWYRSAIFKEPLAR